MSEFKHGDRVKFLNDVGIATVVKVIDKTQVLVKTEDGFEYPCLKSELIHTDQLPEGKTKTETYSEISAKPESAEKDLVILPAVESGSDGPLLLFLGFQHVNPDNLLQGEFFLHLINNGKFHLLYCISRGSETRAIFIKSGSLQPGASIKLGKFFAEDFTGISKGIFLQLLVFTKSLYVRYDPISMKINPPLTDLSSAGSFKKSKLINEDIFLMSVENEMKSEMGSTVRQVYNKIDSEDPVKRPKKKQEPGRSNSNVEEVDLHIHQIIDDYKMLTSGEILKIQLARFRTSLEGAIRSKQSRIIFIHGQGTGKLKFEIRKTIDEDFKNCTYQDASFREYGFGAIMIIIK
jgi:hypothetical protein